MNQPDGPGLAARRVALAALDGVLRRHLPLDEALAVDGLAEARDRAFARLLASTVLRRLGQIDVLLASLVERTLPSKPAMLRHILRLGVAQLVFLDMAGHAAVDTAVELAKGESLAKPLIGLVNALLRRLADEGQALIAAQDAARLNTPAWLWAIWQAAYGEATARAIALAHLGEAPLDISVKTDAAAWAERLEAELLPGGTLRRAAGGAVALLPGFDEGAWWVQDLAAALPVKVLGDVAGRRVADLCAAPGGKTAQLAAAGAVVTAIDRSPPRLARLTANLRRLRLAAEAVAADVAQWRPVQPFDAVLLDAPCSATGTLRRHPDAAWLKTPEDVAKLIAVQDRLLAAAVHLVRPGGVLVYCTCSLDPAEGEARIAAWLAGGAPVRRRPVAAAEVGGLAEVINDAGDVRSLPCHLADRGGMDGFFAARFERL